MDSLTDDICALVLARLPIKIFTGFKLVCKHWKSIVESPFFRKLFMSMHQNSASSSWSIMSTDHVDPEMVGYYNQCDTWGIKRPLGSFIKSFVEDLSFDSNSNHLIKIESSKHKEHKRFVYPVFTALLQCGEAAIHHRGENHVSQSTIINMITEFTKGHTHFLPLSCLELSLSPFCYGSVEDDDDEAKDAFDLA
ncbi:hypothetical protein YC2023_031851 [Brassica napus]